VIGEAILITPILTSFTVGALESVDPQIGSLAKTLGASRTRAELAVLREARKGIVLAVTASFGRAIAELGIALMIGGNIPGSTRVLTTAIAVGVGRGDLELALALAFVLLGIVGAVSILVNQLSGKG
jgi:tungstate transport system permease protein